MLWDVVSDEDIFKFLSPDIQSKIYTLFISNIQGFFEVERTKTNSLVDMNKKYILLILNHIKKTYPYQPSKIKIHNEQPQLKELITFEEIQNDRKSQFEKDFNRRQEEFEDSREDKYVYLDRSFKIKCEYNHKFKRWIPVSLANKNDNIISIKHLLQHY